jgi:putative SOS response-associated peptidase YedK
MINARAEGVADKPAFRQPFRQQRCLIPADGFYEWRHDGGRKQPYYIHRKDNQPLVFAGLWSRWEDRENREIIESCTIITGEPNELVAQIHNRMPVILDYAGCDAWLENDDRASLERLLSPIPAHLLAAYPVSTTVNKPSQGGPGLIEPLGH